MRACPGALLLASVLCAGAGCTPPFPWRVQSEITFALNPNGSGKAEVEAFLNFPLDLKPRDGAAGTHARVQRAVAANAVRRVLAESKGVDAWRDVSWRIEGDGRVRFVGTALFPSFGEVHLTSREHMILDPWHGVFRETPDGRRELAFPDPTTLRAPPPPDAATVAPPDERAAEPTEEQLVERMEAARTRYRASRPQLLSLEKERKRIVRFRLPGVIEETAGLRRDGGLLEAGYDGMARVRALDALFEDDEALRRLVREAGDADAFDAALDMTGPGHSADLESPGLGYGFRVPAFGAVVGGEMRPLFDYAAEVAAAKDEVETLIEELAGMASLDAIRGGPGRAVWLETSSGVFRSGPYPSRSVVCPGTAPFLLAKHIVPVLGLLGYWYLAVHQGPVYLRYPYADERAGTALIVPEFVNLYGRSSSVYLGTAGPYRALVSELDSADGGDRSLRVSGTYLESGDESGVRAEYRVDFPGYFGLDGGSFDVPGRERTYVRFSNAFLMGTRAVASLDLGTAWLDSEHDDARFQWGASADLFPRKPLVMHVSWHSLDGSDHPSETRASVGVALKALELAAGWTRDRGPAGEEQFLELGARLWWAF